jgi:hypothetical protein
MRPLFSTQKVLVIRYFLLFVFMIGTFLGGEAGAAQAGASSA